MGRFPLLVRYLFDRPGLPITPSQVLKVIENKYVFNILTSWASLATSRNLQELIWSPSEPPGAHLELIFILWELPGAHFEPLGRS